MGWDWLTDRMFKKEGIQTYDPCEDVEQEMKESGLKLCPKCRRWNRVEDHTCAYCGAKL